MRAAFEAGIGLDALARLCRALDAADGDERAQLAVLRQFVERRREALADLEVQLATMPTEPAQHAESSAMNSPERLPSETHKPITGYLWGALAVLTCPCHLPILAIVLAGTTAGAFIGEVLGIAAPHADRFVRPVCDTTAVGPSKIDHERFPLRQTTLSLRCPHAGITRLSSFSPSDVAHPWVKHADTGSAA